MFSLVDRSFAFQSGSTIGLLSGSCDILNAVQKMKVPWLFCRGIWEQSVELGLSEHAMRSKGRPPVPVRYEGRQNSQKETSNRHYLWDSVVNWAMKKAEGRSFFQRDTKTSWAYMTAGASEQARGQDIVFPRQGKGAVVASSTPCPILGHAALAGISGDEML